MWRSLTSGNLINVTNINQRVILTLNRVFGNRSKYVIFTFLLTIFVFYALIIQSTEQALWKSLLVVSSSHNSSSTAVPVGKDNTQIPGNDHSSNSSSTDANQSKYNSGYSIWLAFAVSLLSWIFVIQVLRYIRYANLYSSPYYQRQQLFAQLQRQNVPGFSTRLRLAMLNRDFTGDDYEMLQELDDITINGGINHGADEGCIQRLPLRKITENDVQQRQTNESEASAVGHCNICLGPYEVGEEVRTVLCLHQFHKDCIDPWLRTKNACPICKLPATE
jgi:hypothetical protein